MQICLKGRRRYGLCGTPFKGQGVETVAYLIGDSATLMPRENSLLGSMEFPVLLLGNWSLGTAEFRDKPAPLLQGVRAEIEIFPVNSRRAGKTAQRPVVTALSTPPTIFIEPSDGGLCQRNRAMQYLCSRLLVSERLALVRRQRQNCLRTGPFIPGRKLAESDRANRVGVSLSWVCEGAKLLKRSASRYGTRIAALRCQAKAARKRVQDAAARIALSGTSGNRAHHFENP